MWSMGWDKRSLLLQVRSDGAWHTYRSPKGSYTYDPTHGWFTEWPGSVDWRRPAAPEHARDVLRLSRDVRHEGGARYSRALDAPALHDRLHRVERTRGARRRRHVHSPESAGAKPQSNLRFVARPDLATEFGPAFGWGGVWVDDAVTAGQPSDPVLVAGYAQGCLHLTHRAPSDVTFSIELDRSGDGGWQDWRTVTVPAKGYVPLFFDAATPAEWLRVKVDCNCTATAFLHLSSPRTPTPQQGAIFASLAPREAGAAWTGGLLRPAGFSRRCSSWRGGSMAPDGQSIPAYAARSTSSSRSDGRCARQDRRPGAGCRAGD